MTDITRPPLIFTLRLNDEPTEVKMTYGLFNEIMNVVPSPEDIGGLLISDNGLRDYIIRRMLTGSKRVLDEKDMIDPFEMDIDIGELDDLVAWVGDHVMYFFMSSAIKTQALGEKYKAKIAQLNPSETGAVS